MITFILSLLLILTFCFTLLNNKKVSFFLLSTTIICFISIGCGWFPEILLTNLQSPYVKLKPQWQKENAIVLLGVGAIKLPWNNDIEPNMVAYSRMMEAARLYLSCKNSHNQCTLIISGGDALATGKSEAEVYRDRLISLGINSKDLILESKSMNTYENAEFTNRLLRQKPFSQVILVTSGIHMKRSLLYFKQFYISAVSAPSDYLMPVKTVIPIGYNFAMTDFAMHEYIGLARFYVYNYIGWNKNVEK